MPNPTLTDQSLKMTTGIQPLPDVLSGERRTLHDTPAGMISYYVDGPARSNPTPDPDEQPPMLLLHSINASPSAHEIKPLYDAYKTRRRVYAIDLPGFGHSERSDRPYRQPLMVDAILALIDEIRSENPAQSVDAIAVSLSCEFLAKAARQVPESIRSLALVSPTGFARITKTHGPPEANCGIPRVYRVLNWPLFGRTLFRLLTSRPVIRFFLRKTWGSKQIDEEMFHTSCRMARHPGAHHAPFNFVAGYLFSADIPSVFHELEQPVWLVHGVRGDFTDFSRSDKVADKPNWRITALQTGAMPYFEIPEEFVSAYDDFLAKVNARQAVGSNQV